MTWPLRVADPSVSVQGRSSMFKFKVKAALWWLLFCWHALLHCIFSTLKVHRAVCTYRIRCFDREQTYAALHTNDLVHSDAQETPNLKGGQPCNNTLKEAHRVLCGQHRSRAGSRKFSSRVMIYTNYPSSMWLRKHSGWKTAGSIVECFLSQFSTYLQADAMLFTMFCEDFNVSGKKTVPYPFLAANLEQNWEQLAQAQM